MSLAWEQLELFDSSLFERWVPLPGYERHEVSDRGRVRIDGKMAEILIETNGYPFFRALRFGPITDLNRKRSVMVHVAVMLAFVGPRPIAEDGRLCLIRHLDGDKENCAISNLRYGSSRENRADQTVLSEKSRAEIRERLTPWTFAECLALQRRFGLSKESLKEVLEA